MNAPMSSSRISRRRVAQGDPTGPNEPESGPGPANDVNRLLATLRRVSAFFARLPALGYGAIFLAMIPIFAALYAFLLPDEFYSATVTREDHFQEETLILEQELEQAFVTGLGAAYGTYAAPLEGERLLCVDRMHILLFSIANSGYVTLKLAVPTAPATPDTVWCAQDAVDAVEILDASIGFAASLGIEEVDLPTTAGNGGVWLILTFTTTDSQTAAARLFPEPVTPGTFNMTADRVIYGLNVSRSVANHAVEVLDASEGDPSGIPGGFWRMLYLSAITTTTTGYGDIVPITTRARIIATAEAILGIILVGLFLNALAGRRT